MRFLLPMRESRELYRCLLSSYFPVTQHKLINSLCKQQFRQKQNTLYIFQQVFFQIVSIYLSLLKRKAG